MFIYQIRVREHLDDTWSVWFDGLNITHNAETNETTLQGDIIDQAHLQSMLRKIYDLGLTLIAVCLIKTISDSDA